ncbi:MAG TPA: GntR family transcriptional regulator [Streptosporangiaceae bacterium]|jgi:DNA-binding GntR family transcriptional regulator
MPSESNAEPTSGGARALDVSSGKAAGFYELLRADVVSGALRPGQRLSEASLSREYGVSRSPVREALASLERDGLVERIGMIARVCERTAEEMLDIYQVRIYLEGAIAGDAAQRRNTIDVRRLHAALEAGVGIDTTDPKALLSANRVFHDALATACHNATLADLQRRLNAQIATLPAKTLSFPGRWPEAHAEHAGIVTAVETQDADTARTIAERHMTRARDIRLTLYETNFTD